MNNLLKNHSVKLVHDLMVPTMEDYILKASALADRLGVGPAPHSCCWGRDDAPSIDNQGASQMPSPSYQVASQMSPPLQATPDCVSPADIPVTVAFERLNVDLQISPTIGQVEMELDKLALAAKMPLHGVQPLVRSLDFPASPRRGVASSCGGAPRLDLASAGGLDVFFRTPPPPVMSAGPDQPRQVQGRRRRVYDMSKVRRSARLAKKPALPAVKKAQINLCRRGADWAFLKRSTRLWSRCCTTTSPHSAARSLNTSLRRSQRSLACTAISRPSSMRRYLSWLVMASMICRRRSPRLGSSSQACKTELF